MPAPGVTAAAEHREQGHSSPPHFSVIEGVGATEKLLKIGPCLMKT
jgi:hypothetical protein